MKKQLNTIKNVKDELLKIKGQDVLMIVNRGRKKIVKFDAKLINIYPSVFTVYVHDSDQHDRSYSYTEILCGDVKVYPKNL